MKPHDVHSGTCNNFVEDNEEDSKFNVRNHVRMSKYKIGQNKVLWLKKLKILYHKHRGLHGEVFVEVIYKKELQKMYKKGERLW